MNETLPVVMISAHGTPSTAVDAIRRGALDFLEKPFESTERLRVTIQNALEQARLRDENRSLKKAVEVRHQMIGESGALKQVMAAIGRAAPTNATVLIQGESGVGKELVARTIHRNSLRSRERFVQVNCAAIPEDLIESELFGHEKGSFTGATEKQVGKFEQADRGTIFLDEVGDMSAKTQAKVLRVLQEGEVERLGSARTIKVDVRVIAATNKNLEEEIEKGHFREDLYFRLAVIPISVPPLRERPEDIPTARPALHGLLQPREQRAAEEDHARGARGHAAVSLEGQHPRAAEHRRAADHHDRRRHDRRRRSARRRALAVARRRQAAPASRRAAASRRRRARCASSRTTPSARIWSRKLRENGWNISKTAEVIDTPAQQPVQEARAVPDLAGNGRVAWQLRPVRRVQPVPPAAYNDEFAVSQTTAPLKSARAKAGGKSELRRAVRRVTPGQGNLKESGTENIPPAVARSEGRVERVRVKRCGKSAPRRW